MRILRNAVLGTALVVVFVLCCASVANVWAGTHMYYPTPENETAFLREYSLEGVVKPFIAPAGQSGGSHGSGEGAGTDSVKRSARFDRDFSMRSEQRASLMTTVNFDLSQRLQASGARILSLNGAPSTGFRIKYLSGKTVGSAVIHPLSGGVHRNIPLPDGIEDVTLSVEIDEEWLPKGIPLEVARAVPERGR